MRAKSWRRGILGTMRWQACLVAAIVWTVLGCGGGAAAPPPTRRAYGGGGGASSEASGATSSATQAGGATGRTSSGSGGTFSTYTDPGCPQVVAPEIYAECSVADQTTCPAGEGCYPTITYPTAPCQPEIYSMYCLPSGMGQQWDSCESLLDCAAGFICVVTGIGTECQRACDPAAEISTCPKGLFCEAIDLQGIGSCF